MKCSVEINEKVQTELNATIKRNSIIFIVIGAILISINIILSVCVGNNYWFDVILWIGALLFAFGLIYLLTVNKLKKQVAKDNSICNYEFEEEYMNIATSKNGEVVSNVKFYYKDIVKIKESENYWFLYPNKTAAYPIEKSKLTPEELSTLKMWVQSARIIKK